MKVTKVTKGRNVLTIEASTPRFQYKAVMTFGDDERATTAYYTNGRRSMWPMFKRVDWDCDCPVNRSLITKFLVEGCTVYESLLSVPDDIHIEYSGKLMKGLLPYMRKNNLRLLNNDTVHRFKQSTLTRADEIDTWLLENHSVDDEKEWKAIRPCMRSAYKAYTKWLDTPATFNTIFDDDGNWRINHYSITNRHDYTFYARQMGDVFDPVHMTPLNIRVEYEKWRDRARNERIANNQNRIMELNDRTIGEGLHIFVPTEVEQFSDEGNQQGNCVGHYYHDRMADGDTIIFFVRRDEAPTKSYITARYDVRRREVVEYRKKYNAWAEDFTSEARTISDWITEILAR